MPLVTINSLPPTDSEAVPRMIADVRDSGAKALGCPASNIWVIFQPVPPGYYAQDGGPASVPQKKTHPPVVVVRAQAGRSSIARKAFVTAIAAAVGKGLSVPITNVWIHYQEMQPQDVWFEGRFAG